MTYYTIERSPLTLIPLRNSVLGLCNSLDSTTLFSLSITALCGVGARGKISFLSRGQWQGAGRGHGPPDRAPRGREQGIGYLVRREYAPSYVLFLPPFHIQLLSLSLKGL